MDEQLDDEFFNRADAHIRLSNDQLRDIAPGKVSASTMYAAARFNAWVTALGFPSGEEMAEKKDEVIRYFTEQYRLMLSENFDDYASTFDSYMKTP